ncbi:MAG: hypothetical protein ACKOWF_00800 [Chloroflexota bacterium]
MPGLSAAASSVDVGLVPLRGVSCDGPAPPATPAATPTAPATDSRPLLPAGTPVLTEADYPAGEDAGPQTAEAIVALEARYAACLNAGDLPAAAALLADPLRARLFPPALLARKALASPAPAADPVAAIALRCLRQTPDGAAIAYIDRYDRNAVRGATMMRVYRQTPAGWRVVEQAGVKAVTGQPCP